jgi:hypothetical protein
MGTSAAVRAGYAPGIAAIPSLRGSRCVRSRYAITTILAASEADFSRTDGCNLDISSAAFEAVRAAKAPTATVPMHFSLMKAEIMSPDDKHILKSTWAMVAPISDAAAGLFYDRGGPRGWAKAEVNLRQINLCGAFDGRDG